MEIKYFGVNALSRLIEKCKATFALIAHVHTAEEIGADASGSAAASLALAEQYVDEQVATKVDKSGDTMSGYLNFEKSVNGIAHKASIGASSNGNTYIQHYTDGTLDNYITLNKDSSYVSRPWSIDSGGTGANTAAKALMNFGLTATASELNTLDGITASVTELNYTGGVTSNIQAQLDSKSDSEHTHNYAGSSSAGGAATIANQLNTDAGSATQPVYFANGIPVETTYTLGKSVPSDAVFTDTTYTEATVSSSGLMSSADKMQLLNGGDPIVQTAGTGAAYTATIDGLTALTPGMKVTIIPHTVSTTTAPTFNLNSFGAKTIRQPLAYNNATTVAGAVANWLTANKPITLLYDGTYWRTVDLRQASASNFSGTLAIAKGGTGATTATAALTNLGLTATAAELNYCSGVTSNIQAQLDAIGGQSFEVAIYADDYVGDDGTLNIADIPIVSNCIVKFSPKAYIINGTQISSLENIIFDASGAVITINDYLLEILNCSNVSIIGGVYDGAKALALKVQNTSHFTLDSALIKNVGGADIVDVAAIKLLGDCNHFCINRCVIDNVSSGVVYSDGFIHAYGILVNRLGSSNAYSKNGLIRQCTITNVAGIDTDDLKADGEGIFIQNPPYLNDDDEVEWRKDIHIEIDHCIITNCKKRGIKSASAGVYVRNCNIEGDFYYAGIDAQYGNMCIEDSTIINTSDYTQTITSAIVANEGGLEVRRCVIKAPYTDSDGNIAYHPGIRFNKRLGGSIVPSTTPWDNIYIDNCYFGQVSRAVYGHVSDSTALIPIRGLYVTNCRIGAFNQAYAVHISDTMFSSMETFVVTDWRFDYGITRDEVRTKNSGFVYPIHIDLDPTLAYELHSSHWLSEPQSGCTDLPTSPNGYIEYVGNTTSGIGGVYYKKYTAHGSKIIGSKDPSEVTSTLGLQLLWNSRIGDEYINRSNGNKWICTKAGTVTVGANGTTSGTIGTWTQICTQAYIDNEILGGAS